MKGGHNDMTQNQIAFVKYMEESRHNRATEELTKYTADLQASTSRYIADLQSATSIKVAYINQATAITTAGIAAAATRYSADVNASTQRAINAKQMEMQDKISKRTTDLGYYKTNTDIAFKTVDNFNKSFELDLKKRKTDADIDKVYSDIHANWFKNGESATKSIQNLTQSVGNVFNSMEYAKMLAG